MYSKATGNGFPIAAVLRRENVMTACHKSFISSTMWTEGTGPAAALATIRKMLQNDVPAHIDHIGELHQQGMRALARKHSVAAYIGGRHALGLLRFDCTNSDAVLTLFTPLMIERGYLTGGGFYPTFAHQPDHVADYLAAADEALAILKDAIARDDVTRRIGTKTRHSGFARLT